MDLPLSDDELATLSQLDKDLSESFRLIDEERAAAFRQAHCDKVIPSELPGLPGDSSPARLYGGLLDDLARADEQARSFSVGQKADGRREQMEIRDLLGVFAAFHTQLHERLHGSLTVAEAVNDQLIDAATRILNSPRDGDGKKKLVNRLVTIAQSYVKYYGGQIGDVPLDTVGQLNMAAETTYSKHIRHDLPEGSRARGLYESVFDAYTETLGQCGSESPTEMSIDAATRYLTNKQLGVFHTFHRNVTVRVRGGFAPRDAIMAEAGLARRKLMQSGTRRVTEKVFTEFLRQLEEAYLDLYEVDEDR